MAHAGRIWGRWALGTVCAVVAVILAVLSPDQAVRSSVKGRLRTLDSRYLGGQIRRFYHRSQLTAPGGAPPTPSREGYSWLGDEPFLAVAHAMGPTFHAGPNSVPTFLRGLGLGFRLFEVDLARTVDGRVVCYHGNDATAELRSLTHAAYMDSMHARGIEPCGLADLVGLARQHHGVRFILDAKNDVEGIYSELSAVATAAGIGGAFIPQVYEFSQLAALRRRATLAGEIFTSYRSVLTTEEIFAGARRQGVGVVALTVERFAALNGRLPSDLIVLVHSVEDPARAAEMRLAGARGIYTSYVAPNTVPELFARWTDGCQPPSRFACAPRMLQTTPTR
jgi:glycerophosphoryl diester phosphodiesterase